MLWENIVRMVGVRFFYKIGNFEESGVTFYKVIK